VPEYFADPRKAHEVLKWKTEFDLDKMCQDSWNWQSKNQNGYLG
jgi:UDP-glucose 4-epimerase